jgi:hypothetical protein
MSTLYEDEVGGSVVGIIKCNIFIIYGLMISTYMQLEVINDQMSIR